MSVMEYVSLDILTGTGALSIALCNNGTDSIFWGGQGLDGNVYQYNVATETLDILGNGDSSTYARRFGAGLVCFKGNVYQMRSAADFSGVKIYKWNGSVWSTAYTPVNDPTIFFTLPGFWASDNLMVALIPGDGVTGKMCVYSADGTTWTQGKVLGSTTTPLLEVFNKDNHFVYPGRDNSLNVGTGEVYAELTLTNNNSSDGRTRIYKFDEATHDWLDQQGSDWGFDWAPPGTSPNNSIRYLCAAGDRHWKIDSGSYYYSSDFITWTLIPSTPTIIPIAQQDMPYTCGYERLPVPNTNRIYAWWDDMSQWVQMAFHETQSTWGDPFVVVNINGIMYLINRQSSTNRILEAFNASGAVPYDCLGTNRLWIYTIGSAGITSRGVTVTAP